MYVPRLLLTALVGALTMVLVAVLGSGVGSAPAQAAEAPESPDFPTALSYSWLNLEATPPGANDWSCRPSQRHPRPVVLLHGTWENRYANFAKLSPELKREGYCVFALNYGWQPTSLFGLHPAVKGTADIRRSSKELAAYVEKVLGTTGAPQVDIVGHSQGGMMPRQYLKFDGGANPANPAANKVHTLVGFGPTNHGTTLSGLATLSDALGVTEYGNVLLGDSATQQVKGSPFLAELNAGGDTMPGVNYIDRKSVV